MFTPKLRVTIDSFATTEAAHRAVADLLIEHRQHGSKRVSSFAHYDYSMGYSYGNWQPQLPESTTTNATTSSLQAQTDVQTLLDYIRNRRDLFERQAKQLLEGVPLSPEHRAHYLTELGESDYM